MARINLGFGTMRLPLNGGGPADFDHKQICDMFDMFLDRGYTYVDTSWFYHAGHSEEEVRRALVERHNRSEFTLATKMPTPSIDSEDTARKIFDQQLENTGAGYFDYYLIHTLNQQTYQDIAKKYRLFEIMQEKKEAGLVKHSGFSYHDCPEFLDQILTEHPEVEFVQLALNYLDWDSEWVRARDCAEVVRNHGKWLIAMEPVKGGTLSKVPAEIEAEMRRLQPGKSPSWWALRYANEIEGVKVVLSGMSTIEQMDENTIEMADVSPMTEEEKVLCEKAATALREAGPLHIGDFKPYRGIAANGMPVAGILDAYNTAFLNPDPYFACEHGYYKCEKWRAGRAQKDSWLEGQTIFDAAGKDITPMVAKCEKWLIDNSF